MTDVILTLSKYLIIVLFAYFVYVSFRAQRDVPDQKKKTSYMLQRVFIFIIHGIAYLSIFINITTNSDISTKFGQAFAFYLGQVLYLIIISIVIPRFVSLSQGLNNVMCMFLAICFIVQTRLSFSSSLRQFFILLGGTVVFFVFIFLCKRVTFLNQLTWIYCAVGMVLLLLVLILSSVTKGAKLALDFGFFSFQPMEFVKILFVMFVASAFNKANNFRTVIITAACAAIHVLIVVFCRDLGSAMILSVIYVLMLYVATKKIRYIGIGIAGFAFAAFLAFKAFNHVQVRVFTWLNPWTDMDGMGYQITQSLFAIGTGGWFGSGLYRGSPNYVPEVSNDMVFSAIAEELGGLFAMMLILLCLCFTLMILRVAIRVEKTFYKLLAFGLATSYALQVFLTIGGSMKFIPLTGVNLPFISSGGSSLIASMVIVGIVQALYVISEADVERERELIADRIKINPHHIPQKERIKSLEYNNDYVDDNVISQKDRIKNIDPDDFESDDDFELD